jgi:8-oxo-dGTP diphosphatase
VTAATARVRVVAALIHTDGGRRVLVQERPEGKRRGLSWEFPGGKVEPGESDAAALQREAREELGVELEVGAQRFHARHVYPDIEVDLHVYRASIVSGTPRPLGGQRVREATRDELRALVFCEADRPLVDELLAEASEVAGRLPG